MAVEAIWGAIAGVQRFGLAFRELLVDNLVFHHGNEGGVRASVQPPNERKSGDGRLAGVRQAA